MLVMNFLDTAADRYLSSDKHFFVIFAAIAATESSGGDLGL